MFRRNRDKSNEAGAKPAQNAKAENPYIANRRETDDRYMNLSVSRQNWIRAFQITSGLLAVSIAFNGYYMTQSKFVPYIVEVDKIGNIIAVGVADKTNPVDQKRIVRATLITWIENSRTIISDRLALKKNYEKVYAHVASTGKAKKQLDTYYKEKQPFDVATKQTVSAEVTVALPTGGNTWQIEWTETTRNQAGEVIGLPERWKALVTYDHVPLTTDEAIRANPSGIFITDFSWSKQI